MKRILLVAIATAFSTCSAHAGFLHFDDLAGGSGSTSFTSYGGFTWSSTGGSPDWYTLDDTAYTTTWNNNYTAPTASNAVFNGFGRTGISSTTGSDFDFNGAYFTSWVDSDTYQSYSSRTITVEGWDDGVMVATQTMALSNTAYTWFAASASFSSIDALVFKNDTGQDNRWWLMDNFTYNMNPVPEPASLALWGLGALGACVYTRRRRRQA